MDRTHLRHSRKPSPRAPRTQVLQYYLLLISWAVLVLYPMFWLLSTSLKTSWEIFQDPWALPTSMRWTPHPITETRAIPLPENYHNAFTMGKLGRNFANSVFVTALSLAAVLLIASMASYVLARFVFPGARALYYTFIGGMALPAFLAIVPLFLLMNRLRFMGSPLFDTLTGLVVVYTAFSIPFCIFLLTAFFRTLPHELAEAAVIDGCTPYGVFWRIMLPLARPGLVTAGTFVFISLWNEYPLALVLAPSESRHTLPVGIAKLTMTQMYQSDWGALFAALTISMIPTIALYAVFQKQIQAGLTAGAVKG